MNSEFEKYQRLYSALGFAMKAGKVRSGELSVEKAVKNGKACVVVVDSTASEATKKRWGDTCSHHGIKQISFDNVGKAIGRDAHIVACIVDNGFAQMIMRAYNDFES